MYVCQCANMFKCLRFIFQIILMGSHATNNTDGLIAIDDLKIETRSCSDRGFDDTIYSVKNFEVDASGYTSLEEESNHSWVLNYTNVNSDHTLGTSYGHYALWRVDNSTAAATGVMKSTNFSILYSDS